MKQASEGKLGAFAASYAKAGGAKRAWMRIFHPRRFNLMVEGLAREKEAMAKENENLNSRAAALTAALEGQKGLHRMLLHDLKSPLHTILGPSKMLLDEYSGKLDEDASALLGGIRSSALQAAHILDSFSILLSSEKFAPSPAIFSVREVAAEEIRLSMHVAAAKGITLAISGPESKAYADPNLAAFVVRNLVANAIKFTERSARGAVAVSISEAGESVQVSVSDNGVGMPPGTVDRFGLDERLASSRGTDGERGFGLGLQACRKAVHGWGGRIWIESKPREGTKVSFTIPKNPPAQGSQG